MTDAQRQTASSEQELASQSPQSVVPAVSPPEDMPEKPHTNFGGAIFLGILLAIFLGIYGIAQPVGKGCLDVIINIIHGTNSKHEQILGLIIVVAISTALFGLRQWFRITYSLVEFSFGIFSIWSSFGQSKPEMAAVATLGAGIYLIVRALDNFRESAQNHWRKLNGSALLPEVIAGVIFKDGTKLAA